VFNNFIFDLRLMKFSFPNQKAVFLLLDSFSAEKELTQNSSNPNIVISFGH